MSDVHCRRYIDADRDELVALWERVFPHASPHNAPLKMLTEKLKVDDLVFVATLDGDIVGACMAGYDGHRGWLYAVAVAPEQRRTGVGRALLRYTLSALARLGCGKVNLQIRAGNSEVIAFYRSLGFVIEARVSMACRLTEG